MANEITVWKLNELLQRKNGEGFFRAISSLFQSKNDDIKDFIQNKSIESFKRKDSVTYLVISRDTKTGCYDFLGFFSLSLKALYFPVLSLKGTDEKKISRLSADRRINRRNHLVPAILLSQLGRNFDEHSDSIKGTELLELVYSKFREVQSFIGGCLLCVDCKPDMDWFYIENKFIYYNVTKNIKGNKLHQYYKIIK